MRSLSLDGPPIVAGAATGSVCYVAGTAADVVSPDAREALRAAVGSPRGRDGSR